MALPADYHMHTPLCHHAKGEPWELAAQAVQKGLSEIGFSEHNPMIRDDWDDWHMVRNDLELYVANVEKARQDVPDLQIKLALETDYIPGHEAWVRELKEQADFDYFIGSVHYITDTFDIDNPNKKDLWERGDVNALGHLPRPWPWPTVRCAWPLPHDPWMRNRSSRWAFAG